MASGRRVPRAQGNLLRGAPQQSTVKAIGTPWQRLRRDLTIAEVTEPRFHNLTSQHIENALFASKP